MSTLSGADKQNKNSDTGTRAILIIASAPLILMIVP
jgi:hypothetical protein